MLKRRSSPCAPAPQDAKPRKRSWLALAAVILLFLVPRWLLNEVTHDFGSVHGRLFEFVQNLLYHHIHEETALFTGLALFSFILFGVMWHKSAGRKRRLYYALFAFFAFQYGAGLLFYILTFHPFRAPAVAPRYFVIFYAVWLAFLLAVLLYEFLSRKRR